MMSDHDHYGEYAEERHRHYDLERDDETAQRDIRRLQEDVRELHTLLDDALGRIRELGSADTRLAAALRKAAAGHEETRRTGLADETHLAIAEELAGAFTVFADCMDEPGPGPAAMKRFMREHPLTPVREPDGEPDDASCPETSNSRHCGHWYEGGRCCACGLTGPEPDDPDQPTNRDIEPEPEGWHDDPGPADYDPGPEADDEGGMPAYRHILPEDYGRGQS